MSLDPRTPVLVGGGQYIHRDAQSDVASGRAPHPMEMAAEAARAALADTSAGGNAAAAIDTLVVLRMISDSSPRRAHAHGRSNNPPRSIGRRIGADPARAIYAEVGGNTPQKYLNTLAERIARGEADAALVCGVEDVATLRAAARAGASLDLHEEIEGSLEDKGFGAPFLNAHEIAHGITFPVQVYPLFEQAIRHARGSSLAEHLLAMGRLFAPFSEVAAANPFAYFPTARSAEELATPGESNRYIALPYPRYMNARDSVDQAAAVLLVSIERARALGIPAERWIFLHGCADAREPLFSDRDRYDACPALRVLGERALAMAGIELDDIELFDLYSCFPSAVEVACAELGLAEDDPRGLTITGGLPFFGGPGNEYSLHAIAEMTRRLRERPDAYGLVTANGGYLSKHSAGIYSARPLEGPWRREDPASYQAALDASPLPLFAEQPAAGDAVIETWTVSYRSAEPLAIVVGRDADGARFLANVAADDRHSLEKLAGEDDCIGWKGRVTPGEVNHFSL